MNQEQNELDEIDEDIDFWMDEFASEIYCHRCRKNHQMIYVDNDPKAIWKLCFECYMNDEKQIKEHKKQREEQEKQEHILQQKKEEKERLVKEEEEKKNKIRFDPNLITKEYNLQLIPVLPNLLVDIVQSYFLEYGLNATTKYEIESIRKKINEYITWDQKYEEFMREEEKNKKQLKEWSLNHNDQNPKAKPVVKKSRKHRKKK